MSRYRPPQKRGACYITPEGEKKLKAELRQLWKIERPQVTAKVHEAAKNGDRSENGDYIYGKQRLREIDRRVRYLTKRLDEINVVTDLPNDTDSVFFGAWVEVEDEQGHNHRYRIVGPDEFDLKNNLLSVDSPMARALLRKTIDDIVSVKTPDGTQEFTVLSISYTP